MKHQRKAALGRESRSGAPGFLRQRIFYAVIIIAAIAAKMLSAADAGAASSSHSLLSATQRQTLTLAQLSPRGRPLRVAYLSTSATMASVWMGKESGAFAKEEP